MPPADPSTWPKLPILPAESVPRRTEAARYGLLFYLAIAGLVFLVGWIGWFGYRAWTLRDLWGQIYAVGDPSRAEAERIQAASRLVANPDVSQQTLEELSIDRRVPDLARYLLAEGLTAEAAGDDPRAYGLAVARSEGWPDWLRLLRLRPIAYAAASGQAVEPEALTELAKHEDGAIASWAIYALAESSPSQLAARDALRARGADGSDELAGILLEAFEADRASKASRLDRATQWMRANHPGAARVWEGWQQRGDQVVPAGP